MTSPINNNNPPPPVSLNNPPLVTVNTNTEKPVDDVAAKNMQAQQVDAAIASINSIDSTTTQQDLIIQNLQQSVRTQEAQVSDQASRRNLTNLSGGNKI